MSLRNIGYKLKKSWIYLKAVLQLLNIYFFYCFKKKDSRNVLIIPQFDVPGGTRNYFYAVVDYFLSRNKKVTVILQESQLYEEVKQYLEIRGCEIIISQFQPEEIRFSNKIFCRANIKPAKLFVNEVFYFAKLLKKNSFSSIFISVSTPDDYLPFFYFPMKIIYCIHSTPWFKLDKIKRLFLQYSFSKDRILLSVSAFTFNEIIRQWKVNPRYVKYIYNFYEANKNDIFVQRTNEINILTLGTLNWFKNPLFWIDTAKQIIDRHKPLKINFTWAGDGKLMQECLIASSNYPSIKFIGFQKNVDSLYQNSDIYFQPSVLESHGISVVGAMCHGLPCVVSNNTGMADSVKDGTTGFHFSIENQNEAIDKLTTLIQDTDLRNLFGQNGKQRYSEMFTKEIWVSNMDQLII